MKTQADNKRRTGALMMLAASVLFATGGLLMKIIPWNPMTINGARNLLGSMVIGLYILLTRHRLKVNLTVLAGAFCVGGVTTMMAVATKLTTAGNAIALQYIAPVWIIGLMYLFFRKVPTRTDILAIAVVSVGIVCFFLESLTAGRWLGDGAAVLASLFFAGVYMLNQFEKGDALSSYFIGQLLTGIILTPGIRHETDFSTQTVIAVLLLGIFQVGVAYVCFFFGTLYIDPLTACVINAVEPILNPVLVAVFYGEKLGRLAVIGAGIVIFGIFLYNFGHTEKGRRLSGAG